ncbi:hypothetical protein [Synechococcus sp. UW140]|uniref:hypothetical protein n=1 Tax=Synechococcus sp. UW140 TaxID=368503 RepID=UPI000E0EEA83|nr:hypothetical protein [Synechococcus sp. UW140]
MRIRALGCALLFGLAIGAGSGLSVRAETWDRIGRFAATLRKAGTSTLVARDCPNTLLGAFHSERNALLICANNLPNDPAEIWEVLAHEAAHVMQHCRGGPLLVEGQMDDAIARVRSRSPRLFKELSLYHSSQHRDEVEARLVQTLPPDQVEALFQRFCATRLTGTSSDS